MQLHPLLAASGGELWPFIVGGIFLLIKWLSSKGESAVPPPSTRRPGGTRPAPESEAERTRRFLEALGLPPDSPMPGQRTSGPPPIPRRQEPTTLRQPAAPPPPPVRAPLPVPPVVYEQPARPKKQPPAPTPVSPKTSPLLESDWVPEMTTKAGSVQAGGLKVPEYHEFHTAASEVQAIPFERRAAAAGAPKRGAYSSDELRRLLRNRSSIRAAILLREILGPPPGLQSR
jgi:hypothetical protein